jgi:nucleoside-diphosphate-sugar epimerase
MTDPKIYVAGHRGMVGSAIFRHLLLQGITPSQIITRTHTELDLTNQLAVRHHGAEFQKFLCLHFPIPLGILPHLIYFFIC